MLSTAKKAYLSAGVLASPILLAGPASAQTAPTNTRDALTQGFDANKTELLAVGLLAVVPGLAIWVAPQAVTFGKKMYNRARS